MAQTRLEEIRHTRIAKLNQLKKLGVDPYPAKSSFSTISISAARKSLGETVSMSGRIWKFREHGNVIFADLKDAAGQIQLLFQKNNLADQFNLVKLFDSGDFLAVSGKVITTQAGETTLDVSGFEILAKSLRPLPDDWFGLKDIEERYRQRYVDLLLNNQVRKVFLTRTKIITLLRQALDKEGFVEVETPVLQAIYGGAAAKPFTTHHNALDVDFYLRISDELYLKRLIVGGFNKVYEIGKDFRNEGIDRAHNPEFSVLEFYWAYADYQDLMQFTERLLSNIVKRIRHSYQLSYQGQQIDFSPSWPRISYRDAILKHSKIDIDVSNSEEKLKAAIKEQGINLGDKRPVGFGDLLDTLYKVTTRPHLIGPLFLTDRPTEFVTLAKRLPNDAAKTASFQLLIAGEEVINAYNELNDPQDQAQRWHESEELGEKGHEEHEVFDEDYIRALEYGMPPTAGWGIGIDRFTAILTDQPSLKDTILFPTLRPEK